MKIKKHLVAVTLAVGLAGSATATATPGTTLDAQAGWAIAKYAMNDHPGAQAFMQAAGGTLGGGAAGLAGALAGAKLGAKVGAVIGGLGGLAIGAGLGAL